MSKRWLVIIPVTAFAVWFLLLRGAPADTVAVTRGDAIRAIYATGVVEPLHWSKLAPHRTARLVGILRDEGDLVSKGEAVAVMESRVEEGRLQEAQARFDFTSKELARNRMLAKQHAVSDSALEDSQRDYKEAEARLHAARQEVEDLKLLAPVEGMVLRRDVEPGETVQAGQVVYWVGAPKPLRIIAEVDEEDIGQVAIGQTALIKADAFPGQVLEGTVNEITPKGDPINKVFRVRIALPDETPLMISMTVEVNIIAARVADALLVPAASVRDGKVWRAEGSRAVETPIKIGAQGDTHVQVIEGLQEGDRILRIPPELTKK